MGNEVGMPETCEKTKKRRVHKDIDKENGAPENQDKENGQPEDHEKGNRMDNQQSFGSADSLSAPTSVKRPRDPRPEWQRGLAQKILEKNGSSRRPGSALKSLHPWEFQSMRGWDA